ncbi:MAG TPA: 2-C-methyl-D-erythritol 4-phosphate cytidylyltransferase [Egicoccus sp.]|nr:2-C-methyl-D-erythritol 4-phosphate cytidylyltransferase [Egicoccus sp.]HSK24727.1 2-C-methyl-D-erythritol 4-phosphate cytidylyltransferase [Egicoccus sp.]
MRTGVIVVAAGRGERLGHDRPKALVELGGRPLLHHALAGLAAAGLPPAVVVHTPGARAAFEAATADLEVAALVAGGDSRTASVAAGLAALGDVEVVLVHDAARALAPAPVIRAVAAAITGDVVAAAPGLPVSDTLKRVEGDTVVATVPRDDLVAIQTPQGFTRQALVAAHAPGGDATDDLALVEQALAAGRLHGRVVVVPGAVEALKVTYASDLLVAEAILRNRHEG